MRAQEHSHDPETICEHVLAERRHSVSSTSSEPLNIAIFPPVPLPGRARRRSSVRRESSSVPESAMPRSLNGVCTICGCACACEASTSSRRRPGPVTASGSFVSVSPTMSVSAPTSPPTLSMPPAHSPTHTHKTPNYIQHEPSSLAPRTSPVVEERLSEEESASSGQSTKVSHEHDRKRRQATAPELSEKEKDAAENTKRPRGRARMFRYLPSNGEYDCESQEMTRTWGVWANESVKTSALVPALVMQALATGVLDSTTYTDFQTFASNQTGNAILLTVAAVGTATILLILTAVSFGSFLLGAFVFGQIGHVVGVRRRAWLLVSTSLQTICLVVACILLSPHGPKATQLGGPHEWVILSMFALMSGGQVAMARQSSCQELPTAPMTSTFVDFVADHYLFASWNDSKATSRNRRLYYVVAMLGGSFIGAVMHKYSSSWVVATVAVGVKLLALALIALAKPDGCYD